MILKNIFDVFFWNIQKCHAELGQKYAWSGHRVEMSSQADAT